MTTKIIDNTVISASLKEINSINLIAKCLERYSLATSIEVYDETKEGFNHLDCYKQISIFDMKDNKLLLCLLNIYPTDTLTYIKGSCLRFWLL